MVPFRGLPRYCLQTLKMLTVSGSQFDDARCEAPDGSQRCLTGACQGRVGSQLDGNQNDSTAESFCCLAEESQPKTWDDNGALVLSPLPTGLVDWTSLYRDELSKRVVQNMGV
jgi:hypothetical protein